MLIAGVIVWTLPLLWSSQTAWRLNAAPRCLALWAMAWFYIVLLFTTPCRTMRPAVLAIITAAAGLQAAHALWQLTDIAALPDGRPYGSFQQVNVLASYLATGIACALWLFLHSSRRISQHVSGTVLFFLPAVLAMLQSRAGLLGAMLAAILLLATARRAQACRALALMASGVGAGLLWLWAGPLVLPEWAPPLIDKTSSTHSRLYMLQLTWQLIRQHPVTGNGYGGFEALYGQLARAVPPGLEAATVKYPHNELLFAWAEGGVVAVLGLLLMVAGIVKRLFSASGTGIAGLAFLLPIAVHMNLEYPLYQSATHSLTLIMLLVIGGPGVKRLAINPGRSMRGNTEIARAGRWVTGATATAGLLFMITGLQTQHRLTRVEQQGLLPLVSNEPQVLASLYNPWSQASRLDFDRHVALLLRFNHTRDPALLDAFRRWGTTYSETHNDPEVYASLLAIARAQRLPEADRLCQQAHGRWLNDPRFRCQ
ncbi:Wzy polymerase domain-containing protein [Siccibacter colletis]|uniref:PglL family O-oligosaccharyltransferase n=1 Tax=Siccibacter colletis TaxID=1505757 RepID=UPI003CEB5C99